MPFELGTRGEGYSAEHVLNALRLDGPAIIAVQDVSREFHILALAGCAVELNQRHFYFRMSGDDWLLVRSRAVVRQHEVVHHTLARVHERGVTGCAIVGN